MCRAVSSKKRNAISDGKRRINHLLLLLIVRDPAGERVGLRTVVVLHHQPCVVPKRITFGASPAHAIRTAIGQQFFKANRHSGGWKIVALVLVVCLISITNIPGAPWTAGRDRLPARR
ncbi:hypothetical protein [Paraburkholderia sp. BL6669N2]|uniref:hypothetical protein n=1 Tax=Paraburkholderia sp. BL6669N2 TaxID=1938807 RepID=UPI0015F24FB3|nr:hypothetical protein [Paraburkholderia sp. BL6669N2]